MKNWTGVRRGGLTRVVPLWLAVIMMVAGPALVAQAADGFEVVIPIDTVVRAPEGSITQLTAPVDVPAENQGETCKVTSVATNQGSVHPNNDIIVESGSTSVVVPDVEAVPGGTVAGDGILTLGSSIDVSLRMGADEVFSAGFDVIIDCVALRPGRIIVVKQVTDGSDTTQSFNFAASYDADGFALSDGESNDSGDLDAGTYSVSETVPAGWTQVSAVCDDQSPVDAIDLQGGETVTCTFTNEENPTPPDPGRIIVVKQVTDGSDTTQSFDFAASYDADGFALSDGESNDSGDLDAGTYSVSETVPAGWTQVSAVCDDQSPVDAIDLQAGETVTCTFTNQIEDVVGASITVSVGQTCVTEGTEGHGVISVDISVADGATVVVSDSDGGVVGTFSSDGSVTVPEGATYSWLATPNDGFEFPAGFDSSGTVTVETCSTTNVLPFTGIFADQLATLGFILLGAGVLVMGSGWYLFGRKNES
jgi:hypothetical protein